MNIDEEYPKMLEEAFGTYLKSVEHASCLRVIHTEFVKEYEKYPQHMNAKLTKDKTLIFNVAAIGNSLHYWEPSEAEAFVDALKQVDSRCKNLTISMGRFT